MKTLQHIASISTGVFAKTALRGDIVYLQTKHFDEAGTINKDLFPDLISDRALDKHILQIGDILFSAKGTKNFATCYQNSNVPAVASTSFFVIRIKNQGLLPEFLTWFLNTPEVQQKLKANALGSSMPSISKKVLEALEVPTPSTDMQQMILRIAGLRKQENQIINRIQVLKEDQIQHSLLNAIK